MGDSVFAQLTGYKVSRLLEGLHANQNATLDALNNVYAQLETQQHKANLAKILNSTPRLHVEQFQTTLQEISCLQDLLLKMHTLLKPEIRITASASFSSFVCEQVKAAASTVVLAAQDVRPLIEMFSVKDERVLLLNHFQQKQVVFLRLRMHFESLVGRRKDVLLILSKSCIACPTKQHKRLMLIWDSVPMEDLLAHLAKLEFPSAQDEEAFTDPYIKQVYDEILQEQADVEEATKKKQSLVVQVVELAPEDLNSSFDDSAQLGAGSQATVYKAMWVSQQLTVAVKLFELGRFRQWQSELQLLAQLRYPYIITVYGYFSQRIASTRAVQFAIVMERMLGRLEDLVFDSTKLLNDRIRMRIIRHMAMALNYLHTTTEDHHASVAVQSQAAATGSGGPAAAASARATVTVEVNSAFAGRHVQHRDVKLSNFLYALGDPHGLEGDPSMSTLVCKLADFGLSAASTTSASADAITFVESTQLVRQTSTGGAPSLSPNCNVTTSRPGTMAYHPPEMYSGTSHPLTRAGDVWAFGVCAWEVATRCRVFPEDGPHPYVAKQIQAVLLEKGAIEEHFKNRLKQEEKNSAVTSSLIGTAPIQHIIRACLNYDVDSRGTMFDVLKTFTKPSL